MYYIFPTAGKTVILQEVTFYRQPASLCWPFLLSSLPLFLLRRVLVWLAEWRGRHEVLMSVAKPLGIGDTYPWKTDVW